ncbi:protein of unknown function [Nitrospina watsonii]|uniref:Uncharacterized protein n=1 Tax=Nitrospina watsonii TaxID=1323948 RepID=A0ABM9HFN2_9BACT|nr:protein of unknown function [Nitrospina watsonii]
MPCDRKAMGKLREQGVCLSCLQRMGDAVFALLSIKPASLCYLARAVNCKCKRIGYNADSNASFSLSWHGSGPASHFIFGWRLC